MSGESEAHVALVSNLVNAVQKQHGCAQNLALYLDDNSREAQRPQRINGHLPDLYAEDVPRTFIVIGEAKTYNDLVTKRSRHQIGAFLQYLALFDLAFFYLAVPILAKPSATNLLNELAREYSQVNAAVLPIDGVY